MEDREGVRPRAGGCPPMPPVRAAKLDIARIAAVARVVILHGRVGAEEYFSARYPSASNSHWIPWLQKQLLIKGHDVQTPEVVRPYLVDYDGWWCKSANSCWCSGRLRADWSRAIYPPICQGNFTPQTCRRSARCFALHDPAPALGAAQP
jgi:hypothetical protein